ncbi:MAG: PDZ domain-containing protein [Chloroflexi bacterium]|nr:MAG: PDZ domain-containing protein [Chloroflexota bacterium]
MIDNILCRAFIGKKYPDVAVRQMCVTICCFAIRVLPFTSTVGLSVLQARAILYVKLLEKQKEFTMRTRLWQRVLPIVLIILTMSVLGAGMLSAQDGTVAQPVNIFAEFTQVYEDVSPSVVAITVTVDFRNREVTGGGSGFVIDQDGHIVTNNHVVDDASRIEIEFFDGTLVEAEIVGLDPDSDLAVLHVDLPPERLFPVEFGDSDALQVGQPVIAIGSPFSQNWTLTSGIISGLNRTIRGLGDFSVGGVIQTDTAINPGNSGGPLLDLEGRVIGVNSQILSRARVSSGVGFAIPSNLTQRVANELIANGVVNYSYIGISGSDVTLDLIQELNLPNDTRGVVVTNAVPGGPASLSGIIGQSTAPVGDVITAINGTPVKGMDDLISQLARNTLPGDTITVTIIHNGSEELEREIVLTSRP